MHLQACTSKSNSILMFQWIQDNDISTRTHGNHCPRLAVIIGISEASCASILHSTFDIYMRLVKNLKTQAVIWAQTKYINNIPDELLMFCSKLQRVMKSCNIFSPIISIHVTFFTSTKCFYASDTHIPHLSEFMNICIKYALLWIDKLCLFNISKLEF